MQRNASLETKHSANWLVKDVFCGTLILKLIGVEDTLRIKHSDNLPAWSNKSYMEVKCYWRE